MGKKCVTLHLKKKQFQLHLRTINNLFRKVSWNKFKIEHKKSKPSEKKLEQVKGYIKDNVKDKGGIYCYFDKKGRLLYVGEGNNLYKRIYAHYQIAYKRLKSDHSDTWHDFFSENTGELTIKWCELKDDIGRKIVEHHLASINKTKFLLFKLKRKTAPEKGFNCYRQFAFLI